MDRTAWTLPLPQTRATTYSRFADTSMFNDEVADYSFFCSGSSGILTRPSGIHLRAIQSVLPALHQETWPGNVPRIPLDMMTSGRRNWGAVLECISLTLWPCKHFVSFTTFLYFFFRWTSTPSHLHTNSLMISDSRFQSSRWHASFFVYYTLNYLFTLHCCLMLYLCMGTWIEMALWPYPY